MRAADRLGFLPGAFLRRLLVGPAPLHLPEDPFTLHFFLERAKRLIDVIVTDEYLNQNRLLRVAHVPLRADKYGARLDNARKKFGFWETEPAANVVFVHVLVAARQAQERGDPEHRVRIGLTTGEVVVRAIRNDLSMDYDAVGPSVHLASRLEQLAVPNSIRLTRETYALASGHMVAQSLGLQQIRGLTNPIEIFELVGPAADQTRLRGLATQNPMRFVGPEQEYEMLRASFHRVLEGNGQVFGIVGEPGVRKSRMCLEFARSSDVTNCQILDTGGISYRRGAAYLALILLRRVAEPTGEAFEDTLHRHPYSQVLGYTGRGVLNLIRGNTGRAIETFQEVFRVCDEEEVHTMHAFVAARLGMSYSAAGRFEEAIPVVEDALDRERQIYVVLSALCAE